MKLDDIAKDLDGNDLSSSTLVDLESEVESFISVIEKRFDVPLYRADMSWASGGLYASVEPPGEVVLNPSLGPRILFSIYARLVCIIPENCVSRDFVEYIKEVSKDLHFQFVCESELILTRNYVTYENLFFCPA